jgi:ABC-2 type transport system permease protein
VNRRAILAIARRDIRLVLRSRAVLLPMIVVPLIVFVALPGLLAVGMRAVRELPPQLVGMLSVLPGPLAEEMAGLTDTERLLTWVLGYLFAPLLLMVPLLVASVVAADSFAGERERGTIEALLYAPLEDGELYAAKLLGPFVAAVAVGTLGFVLYMVTADIATFDLLGRLLLPNVTWLLLAAWVAPAVAGFGISTMVLVSSHVRGFQEAWQLGGVVVLPVVLLVVAQLAGAIYLSPAVAVALGSGLWVIDLLLLRIGAGTFRRERMILRADP